MMLLRYCDLSSNATPKLVGRKVFHFYYDKKMGILTLKLD